MTNLRIFENRANRRLIEISSSGLASTHALFVPVVPAIFPLRDKFSPSEIIEVRFGNEILRVAFLGILSRRRSIIATDRLIGHLEETDSINVINHLLDVLAWP
jgi:hypothetical protein